MAKVMERSRSEYFSPVRTARRRKIVLSAVILAGVVAGVAMLLLGSTSVGPPPPARADGSQLARGSWCWTEGSEGVCEARDVQRDDLPAIYVDEDGRVEIAMEGSPLTMSGSIDGAVVDVTLRGSEAVVQLPEGSLPGVLSLGVQWDAGDSGFLAWVSRPEDG